MRVYFLTTGFLCILYYAVLVYYSGKLRSTFAVFWLLTGGVHLVIGCAPLPACVYTVLLALCAAGWVFFLLVEVCIIRSMFPGRDREADCILILGAQVRGTKITDSLRRRLERAAGYLEQHPGTKAVVSGGQGPGEEISEAEAMAEYLIRRGIFPDRIELEGKSTSTRENFRFSRKYIDARHSRVGIVTNGFHMYRAVLIAKQEGYQELCRIPATSNPVFQVNYLVREFFAVISVWIHHKKN